MSIIFIVTLDNSTKFKMIYSVTFLLTSKVRTTVVQLSTIKKNNNKPKQKVREVIKLQWHTFKIFSHCSKNKKLKNILLVLTLTIEYILYSCLRWLVTTIMKYILNQFLLFFT